MKILFVSQYFPPEMGAPAARVYELARHWVRRGHKVTVLTGFPNHPTGVLLPEYRAKWRQLFFREQIDDIEVVRVWLLPFPNRKPHERILNYSSFWFSSSLAGLFLTRPDIVIATSPQLLVGVTGWWLGRVKRAPFVFEVRDLWPESLIAVGVSDQHSALYKLLRRIAKFLYRRCDRLVVVTPAFKEYLMANWGIREDKICIVENGVETDLFSPGQEGNVRHQYGIDGKFVVSYIGTLGLAHGLNTLLEVAARFPWDTSHVTFLVVGEGAEKHHLCQLAVKLGLRNVIFVSQQPRALIPNMIRASDACVVILRKQEIFKTVIPTKLLEFMACARPVILGVEGQAREIVERAQAGLCVEPENVEALECAIKQLSSDLALCQKLGEHGRQWIVANASRDKMAGKYLEILESVKA